MANGNSLETDKYKNIYYFMLSGDVYKYVLINSYKKKVLFLLKLMGGYTN